MNAQIAILAAIILASAGTIITMPSALAQICGEQDGYSVTCSIESGTIVVETGEAPKNVTESPSEVTIEVGAVEAENVTEPAPVVVVDPCAPEAHVVDNSTLQCGTGPGLVVQPQVCPPLCGNETAEEPLPYFPEDPAPTEEPMIVPEEPTQEEPMVLPDELRDPMVVN